MRLELPDTVSRETSQRLLAYDDDSHWLCLARVGEKDGDNGMLQVVDPATAKVLKRLEIGATPTALAVDRENIYALSFDADRLTVIRKADFASRDVACGRNPLKLALAGGIPYVINHGDNTLSELGPRPRLHRIPFPGKPDQIIAWENTLLITCHSADELLVLAFDPVTAKFSLLHREKYPYGETSFAGNNSSFFVRGQFGDCLYDLCKIRTDAAKRIWVSDFLSGKLFIIEGR